MAKKMHFTAELPGWSFRPEIVYENVDGCERRLYLLCPAGAGGPEMPKYPLIVFVAGSGWGVQAMYHRIPYLSRLSLRGFVVAEVQYRESKIATFPAQVHDTKRAVDFLLAHAEEYSIDPERVFLMGDSSGAHTALLTAYTSRTGELNPPDAPHWSCPVRGVIDYVAPVDMELQLRTPPPPGNPNADYVKPFLGTDDPQRMAEMLKKSSVDTYITADQPLPPTLIVHGTEDPVVMPEQSWMLERMLQEKGHCAEAWALEGAAHSGAPYWCDDVLDIVESFIRRNI